MTSFHIPNQDPLTGVKQAQSPALDFFSFTSPSDVVAPHPDLFESELDLSLAGFDTVQLQFLALDQPDAVFYRGENPACGPPSTITVSSESASAYDTFSSAHSDIYSYAPSYPLEPLELDMDFNRIRLNAASDYANAAAAQNTASGIAALDAISDRSYNNSDSSSSSGHGLVDLGEADFTSFGALPPSSPSLNGGSVYSDYARDFYPQIANSQPPFIYTGNAVAPSTISSNSSASSSPSHRRATSPIGSLPMPYVSRTGRMHESRQGISSQNTSPPAYDDMPDEDTRRRYPCDKCNRVFARAYNLKTHLATHDPHRAKPFVCSHKSCSRAFSRKHDLQRHLVSIHRSGEASLDAGTESGAGDDETKVGVAAMKEGREWCDECGKSFTPGKKTCCQVDVK